jgi:flagellar hook assembly protein FlgD
VFPGPSQPTSSYNVEETGRTGGRVINGIGFLVILACVFGSFIVAGGKMEVILHALPHKLTAIAGASIGAFLVANSLRTAKLAGKGIKRAFKGPRWTSEMYRDLLTLLFGLLSTFKKGGATGIERHLDNPEESPIFSRYRRYWQTITWSSSSATTQQLVQYSQVEQSIQQTGLLRDLLARMSSNDMAQASSLIGREVEFDSSVAGLAAGPASWSWSLPHKASAITAEILDSSGRVVASAVLDPSKTSGAFQWDGTLADGTRAATGGYVLKLAAKDSSGAAVPATVHSTGRVQEVVQSDGELWLNIGGASLPMSDLLRIAASAPVA